MSRRIPPHSIEAERACLGACMLSITAAMAAFAVVDPTEFYDPAHQDIAAVCRDLSDSGIVPDVLIVTDELRGKGRTHAGGSKGEIGVYVGELMVAAPGTSNADHYARIVRDYSVARRLIQAGQSIEVAGWEAQDITKAVTDAEEAILGVGRVNGEAPGPSMNVADLLAEPIEYDWLVPGLLERGERLIITATEGFGKSTLLRQISVMVAAGMHPFQYSPIPAMSVLVIDAENSSRQTHRKVRPLVEKAGKRLHPDRLRYEFRKEMDLLNPRDYRWLMERMAANRPDLLIIGPLYNLHDGSINEEEPAKVVQRILNRIRDRYGCAIIMEAHSPHQSLSSTKYDLRPIGTSAWKRWPEFGYGLSPHDDNPQELAWFAPWRGDRDEREWPIMLMRGGEWPWQDYHYHAPEEAF